MLGIELRVSSILGKYPTCRANVHLFMTKKPKPGGQELLRPVLYSCSGWTDAVSGLFL